MVPDALSHKPANLNALIESLPPELYEEIAQLNLVIMDASLASILEVAPTLEEEIISAQEYDKSFQLYAKRMQEGHTWDFSRDQHGTLRF